MLAARLNYLAMDRPDIQYATKEANKWMAKPHLHHWMLLKRIARYLLNAPRVIQKFSWQRVVSTVVGYIHSDWAGDLKSGKPTSGGICELGPHVIKTRSSTQRVATTSSAEAGFYALLKCACQTLGILNLGRDFGFDPNATNGVY